MHHHRLAAFTSVALLWAGACGFPEIDFKEKSSSSKQGPASSSGLGGSGGMPISGGNGGTGAMPMTNGGGGSGGSPPACVLGDPNSCDAGDKCSVVDTNTGRVDCVLAGVNPTWARCNGDSDCMNNEWCDIRTSVCHPICEGSVQCPDQTAPCFPARGPTGEIPGLKICASNCHPETTTPCDDTNGPVTCFYDANDSYWDCIRTIGMIEGAACGDIDECDDGLVCTGDGNICELYCEQPGSNSCGFDFCVGFTQAVIHDGTEYGVCR